MNTESIVARIELMERDGHVYAYSDEVPGLNVCGTDRDVVLQDVVTAIKFLYREVRGLNVSVKWIEEDSPLMLRPRTKESRDVALAVAA